MFPVFRLFSPAKCDGTHGVSGWFVRSQCALSTLDTLESGQMERGSKGWPPTASQVREMLSGQTPSAMVAVPGGAMPHQVSGSGGAAALTLPAISLRRATAKQFVQWNVTLNNVIGWYNLTHVVEEGQPPSRAAIHGLYPDLDPEEVEDKYTDALRQYQEENTSLFYVCAPSISLDGEWHSIDLEYILDKFTRGTLRDGNGFLLEFPGSVPKTRGPRPKRDQRSRCARSALLSVLMMMMTR